MNLQTLSFFVLGMGRLGTALSTSLQQQGLTLLGCWNRSQPTTPPPHSLPLHINTLPPKKILESKCLILTVADDALLPLTQKLLDQNLLTHDHILLHCSGRCSSHSLSQLQPNPPHTHPWQQEAGSFHPLQAITSSQEQPLFTGISVGIEGTPKAQEVARALTLTLGGSPFSLDGIDKAMYHAAAVTASNYLVTLAHEASSLMKHAGIPETQSLTLLLPLMQASLDNLKTLGLPNALTGPLARGDQSTIEAHLHTLSNLPPEYSQFYSSLARHTLPLARSLQKQPNKQNLQSIQQLLSPKK